MNAPVDVLAVMDAEIRRAGGDEYLVGRALIQARAAVAELIEAAGLNVYWINGTWYVLLADGKTAFSNVDHPTEYAAKAEAAEALRAALARCGGAK